MEWVPEMNADVASLVGVLGAAKGSDGDVLSWTCYIEGGYGLHVSRFGAWCVAKTVIRQHNGRSPSWMDDDYRIVRSGSHPNDVERSKEAAFEALREYLTTEKGKLEAVLERLDAG